MMAHQDIPRSSKSSYIGPFLFVNHSIGDLSARTHQHAIRTHVQSSYHSWRRKDERRRTSRLGLTRHDVLPNTGPGPPSYTSLVRPLFVFVSSLANVSAV